MVAGARLSQHHGRDSSFAAVVLTGAEAIQTAGLLKLRERGLNLLPWGARGRPRKGHAMTANRGYRSPRRVEAVAPCSEIAWWRLPGSQP
jgi:hypothetical protein